MKILQLVERFGFGLAKTSQAIEQNENPALEYEFVDTAVLFLVRKRP